MKLRDILQVPENQYTARQILRWLWGAWKGNRFQAILNMLIGIAGVVISLSSVWAIQHATDIAAGTYKGSLYGAVGVMAALILMGFGVHIARVWVKNILGVRARNRMQLLMLDRLLRSEWRSKSRFHSGDVINRLEQDVNTVVDFLTETLPNTVSVLAMFAGAFCYLFQMDVYLACITVAILPVFMLLSRIYVGHMRKYTRQVRTSDSRIQGILQETVQYRMLIKTLEASGQMLERLDDNQTELRSRVRRRTVFSVFSNLVLQFGFALGYIIAFLWSALRLYHHTITFGQMTAFLQTNSGLERRFRTIQFDDYGPEALEKIFRNLLQKNGMRLDEGAEKGISAFFRTVYDQRNPQSFGNAGAVVNIFKQAKERQGARLAPMMEKGQCSPDDLRTLTLVDIAGDQARANASTEELMHAFDRLIGAASAKKKMENLLNQIKLNRRRAELTHVPFQNLSICFAFIGHPDTGQKEFRQAMTRVLSDIGLIEKDAVKTWQASQLLTTLTQNGAERRLIDEMLAQHGKTIYIIDANPSEWKEVEEQLPVLSEFINDRFVFDDYTPSELARLFIDYLHQQNMHLADDAQETLVGYFGSHAEGGRSEMKLLFNEVIFRQNTRLASAADISDEALVTIAKEDIPTD